MFKKKNRKNNTRVFGNVKRYELGLEKNREKKARIQAEEQRALNRAPRVISNTSWR